METPLRRSALILQSVLQQVSILIVLALAASLGAWTLAAAFGLLPWLVLDMSLGAQPIENAGMWLQIGLVALAVALAAYLPTNARVMALERSHRRFHLNMRDVAQAYAAAHRADREGVFTLPSEFDSIRERIAFLRDHPDLGDLEPSILEVAAQMSHVSRDLARIYSDSNVMRARDFLIARQQEIEDFNRRLDQAKALATEIRMWHDRVELDEAVAEAQLVRLCEELERVLPEILPEEPRPAPAPAPYVLPAALRTEPQEAAEAERIIAMSARRAAE